ncbi:hypothetical protein [Actinokineospora sp. HUAS TT18]|uniref:hypothetical protein n=1 Tax=Actinokineospora sp. HUAS TT18 TaxID=3447451 RepID=UPI003F52662D
MGQDEHALRGFDPHKRRITYRDGFNRERGIGLWTAPTKGHVVMLAPPAEAALLTPADARALRDRLDELATVVEHQHAEIRRVVKGVRP